MHIRRQKKLFFDHFDRNHDKMIGKDEEQMIDYQDDNYPLKLIGNLSTGHPKINTTKDCR